MPNNDLNIIVRAILEKSSTAQITNEIQKIQKSVKPIEIKVNANSATQSLSRYEKGLNNLIHLYKMKEVSDQQFLKTMETIRSKMQFTTLSQKKQEEVVRLLTQAEKTYQKVVDEGTNINNKRAAEQLRQQQQLIKQTNAVTQSLLNQQNNISRRDFNYGTLMSGVNASTFGSSSNFVDHIKKQYGDSAELIGKFNDKQLKTGEIITQANFRVKEGNDKWRMYQATLNKTTGEMRLLDNGLKDVVNRQLGFSEAMKIAVTRIAQWGLATSVVYGSLRQLRQGLETLKELDSLMVDINKVTDMTVETMNKLKNSSFDVGSKYGKTAQDYLKGVAEFSRAGYEEAAQGLSEVALLSQNVGELTSEQASQFILATDAAYKYKGSQEELTRVLDGVNQIDNKFATSIAKVSEGMTVAGSIASNAGVSIDELSAAIGTMTAVTQKSGNEAGRAFRSILMNINQVKGETEDGEIIDDEALSKSAKALDSVNIKVHELRDGVEELRNPMDVLRELSDKWKTLNSMQQSSIIEAIGGKYRGNFLVGLVENFDMYEKMLSEYAGSANSAMKENEIRMNSWAAKANQLSNTVSAFWNNAINTDFVKNIVDGLNGFIKVLDFLVNNSLSSFVLKIALTTTAVYGLGVAFKALAATTAFTGLTAEIKGFVTGASVFLNTIGSLIAGTTTLNSALTILKTTMLTSPLFFITAGVTAIYGIVKGIDALTVSAEEAKEKLDLIKTSITTLSNELNNTESLSKQYAELSDKTNKTSEEKEKLLDVTKQLGDIFPSIISKYDAEGNAIELNSAKLEKYIQLKQEELDLKKEELAANFRANRGNLANEVTGSPGISNWWNEEISVTDWVKGTSPVDYLKSELAIYDDLLYQLKNQVKSGGKDQIFFRGGWLTQDVIEKEIAQTRTSLNKLLSEQRTYIEQYKQGLKSSLDINDDFKGLGQNALNSFVESIGDNLKGLKASGIDGLDLAETLGSSGKFTNELNKINIEFEKNKTNVNLTEEAYQQWRNGAVTALSDIIQAEGNIASQDVANKMAEDLVDGLGKIQVGAKKTAGSLDTYKQAVNNLATTYKESSTAIKELYGFLDELDKGGLSSDSINKILTDYKQYIPYLEDEVKLRQEITNGINEYQNKIYESYVAMKTNDADFYQQVLANNSGLVSQLSTMYGINLSNYSTLEQAKIGITSGVIGNLAGMWAEYFEAFKSGMVMTQDMLNSQVSSLEGPAAIHTKDYTKVVTPEQYQAMQAQKAIEDAALEQAKKFRSLNVGGGSSGPGGGSSKEKDDWVKDYIESVEAQADAQSKLNDELERQMNLEDSQISLHKDTAMNLQEYLDSLKQQLDTSNLIEDEQRGLAKIMGFYGQTISDLTEKQKECDQTTEDGQQAYNDLGEAIEDCKEKSDEAYKSLVELEAKQREIYGNTILAQIETIEKLSKFGFNTDALFNNLISDTDINKMTQSQKFEYIQKLIDKAQGDIDKQSEDRIKLIEDQKEVYLKASNAKIEAIQAEMDALDEQEEALQRQKDIEEELQNIAQANKELAEAQTKLSNVQKEKNIRIFQNGRFEYIANPQAVKDAQKEVEDAQQALIDAQQSFNDKMTEIAAEDRKKALQAEIDAEKEKQDTKSKFYDEQISDLEDFQKSFMEDFIKGNKELNDQTIKDFGALGITYNKQLEGLFSIISGWATQMRSQLQSVIDKKNEAGAGDLSSGIISTPTASYDSGGEIKRTEPALVHAGEYMLNRDNVRKMGGISGVKNLLSSVNSPVAPTLKFASNLPSIMKQITSSSSTDNSININSLNLPGVTNCDGFVRNIRQKSKQR